MALTVGTRLGPYEITAPIGAGGMGEVYRARDTRLDRDVAVKVIREGVAGSRDRLQRFSQEARAASALNHPNIVTVHDIGSEDGVVFMVMELVEGRSLADALPSGGFAPADVLRIGIQIADACAAAHARQIVHRDLKPANVMMQPDGRVKVLDFGLAKFVEAAGDASSMTQTAAGTVMGTVAYMSPEQAEGRSIDARSDIFSLGAVLYEIATGRRAFPGDTHATVFAALLKEDPPPANLLRGDIPPELGRLLSRCLKKDPDRRVQSMADLKSALEEIKEETSSAESTKRVEPARRSKPMVVAASLCVLAGAGVWAYSTYFRGQATAVETQLVPVPLTTLPGAELAGSFSPDGHEIAFAWNGENEANDIYIKSIGPDPPRRLTTNPLPDVNPRWSPDGRHVAFARVLEPGVVAILLVNASGGSERNLGELFPRISIITNFDLAWTGDSKYILAAAGRAVGQPSHLLRVSVETGEVRTIFNAEAGSAGYNSLDVSPDGRRLAASRDDQGTTSVDIFDLSGDSNVANQRHFRQTAAGAVRWAPDSRDLLFRISANNPSPLFRMSAETGAVTPLLWTGVGATHPAISAGAGRLVFTRNHRDTNIWRLAVGSEPRPTPEKIAVSSFREVAPSYSPDGTRLAFHSNRSGLVQIWIANADGTGARQLTSSVTPLSTTGTPRWSPDSKWISFDSNTDGTYRVYVISASGGEPRVLTTDARGYVSCWSPDGKWVYFTSDRGGRAEIWRAPSEGGTAEQVTTSGAASPSISPDGRWLYFTKNDGAGGLARMPLAGGPEEHLVERLSRYSYAVSNNGVYYVTDTVDVYTPGGVLRYLDLATRKVADVIAIDAPPDLGLALSPDGKYLLFTKVDVVGADLMLVENFK